MPKEVEVEVRKVEELYELDIYLKQSVLEFPRLAKESLTFDGIVNEIRKYFNKVTPDEILFTINLNNRQVTAWSAERAVELIKEEFRE